MSQERKVEYRTFGQNPSGHMSMTAQTSNFFKEANFNENKFLKLQQSGALHHEKPRNPLLAERSPRGSETFDFSVPKIQHPEKERWHYPETDWGLMARFGSQKQVYEAIYERERNHYKDVEEIRAAKIRNAAKVEEEMRKKNEQLKAEELKNAKEEKHFRKLEKMIENPLLFAKHNHSMSREEKQQMHKELDGIIHEYDRQSRAERKALTATLGGMGGLEGRKSRSKDIDVEYFSDPKGESILDYSNKRTLTASTKLLLEKQERAWLATKDIADFKASQIRDMQIDGRPNVLQQYRAERAAKFIEQCGENAIKPPKPREVGETAFRPGGGVFDITQVKTALGNKRNEKTMKKSGSLSSTAGGSTARSGGGNSNNSTPSKLTMQSAPSNASLPIAALQLELAKTEQQIDRQKLKMNLKGSFGNSAKLHAGR